MKPTPWIAALATLALALPSRAQQGPVVGPPAPDAAVLKKPIDARPVWSLHWFESAPELVPIGPIEVPTSTPGISYAGFAYPSLAVLGPAASTPATAPVNPFAVAEAVSADASVRRDGLDSNAKSLDFDAIPGGVVFGLAARPDRYVAGARILFAAHRLAIVVGEETFLLPDASPTLMRSCLAFATRRRPDDVLVNIFPDASVGLAEEFLDTRAGAALIRCDQVPHAAFREYRSGKSLLVDRDVRLRFFDSGLAEPEADLEVRLYRPGGDVFGSTRAQRDDGFAVRGSALEDDLADPTRVAAWIGVFRWALDADPDGVAAVRTALEREPREVVPTPRWVLYRPDDIPLSGRAAQAGEPVGPR
jgi:hypothetical protein